MSGDIPLPDRVCNAHCQRVLQAEDHSEKGFTIIELVMIIVIMGALSASVIFRSPADAIELSNAADIFMMDYREVQLQSMKNGGSYQLVLLTPRTYQLRESDGTVINGETVDLDTVSITGLAATTTFDTMGVPDNSGTVTLTASGGDTLTLTIYSETGAIVRN